MHIHELLYRSFPRDLFWISECARRYTMIFCLFDRIKKYWWNVFYLIQIICRCPQYYNLPAYCRYEQDPNDKCCRKPKCDPSLHVITTTTQTPFITPSSVFPTITGTKAPGKLNLLMPHLLTLKHQVNLQFIYATFTDTKASGKLTIYLCHVYWH
jgi:hypothetical protein